MVRIWLAIALCGCGRFGFDAIAAHGDGGDGAGPDAPDVGYFVSPTGSNSNPGTRAQPWGTLPFAVAQLKAGDTLNLVDGDYDGTTAVGTVSIDCTMGIANGTAAAPIVVRADHPRKAHLFGTSSELFVANCAYWEFHDLYLEGVDDMAVTNVSLVQTYQADHVTLHGLLGRKPNRFGNTDVFEVDHSTNMLVEDVEAYDYHRSGVIVYDSTNVTVRRAYCNGRGYPDIQGGFASACAGGDYCYVAYYTRSGILEDSVSENTCYAPFGVSAGPGVSGSTGVGDGQLLVNNVALGPGKHGFEVVTGCTQSTPCTSADQIAENNTIRNGVAIGFDIGFLFQGIGNQLDHVTSIGPAGGTLVSFTVAMPADPGLSATASGSAILGTGGTLGVSSTNQTNWGVDTSNVVSGTPYSPNDSHVTNSTSTDPKLGGCQVYIPPTSPMATAGPGGTPLGADVRTQTQDGTATATPFWTASGAFAGCGATVPGVNDDPSTACTGVGARLLVGLGGCPAP